MNKKTKVILEAEATIKRIQESGEVWKTKLYKNHLNEWDYSIYLYKATKNLKG